VITAAATPAVIRNVALMKVRRAAAARRCIAAEISAYLGAPARLLAPLTADSCQMPVPRLARIAQAGPMTP
jgi:hypothetical protein